MEFKEKIKAVRLKLLMSQEEFAKELGVSFASVNRWELGKCKPVYKAQKAFRGLCQKHNIDFEKIGEKQ